MALNTGVDRINGGRLQPVIQLVAEIQVVVVTQSSGQRGTPRMYSLASALGVAWKLCGAMVVPRHQP